jgi:hypothetical protein
MEITGIPDHSGPSAVTGIEPKPVEIARRREPIRMIDRQSNLRDCIEPSGSAKAETDRGTAESEQTTPLSEPNGPEQHAGESALHPSQGSFRRDPTGSEDTHIVRN